MLKSNVLADTRVK